MQGGKPVGVWIALPVNFRHPSSGELELAKETKMIYGISCITMILIMLFGNYNST